MLKCACSGDYILTSTEEENLPFEKLANTLNRIPNGFAKTEDDTYLRVLKWIFTPEEAELASKMKLKSETLKKMSRRLKIPVSVLEEKMIVMKSKGQIYINKTKSGEKKYGLMPFAIGIYEDQIHRIDSEFSEIMEEYFDKTKGEILFSSDPPITKVIPVKSAIKTEIGIHPRNEAEKLIMNAKSWGLRECICKIQQEEIGNPCKYPKEVCLMFSSKENDYVDSHKTKIITKEEALEVLRKAERAGLIHSKMNISEGQDFICNCCTCCCGVLRALVQYDQPNAFVKSDYQIKIDEERCSGCGICIDRCQFNALELHDEKSIVNDRCVGCGNCVITCPEEAVFLVPREKSDISSPPKNLTAWMIKRAIKRKVNLFKLL